MKNKEFLTLIFGQSSPHVTEFDYPPDAIPQEATRACWAGWKYNGNELTQKNQYFTISTFTTDKRRKEDFAACHVIVVDDVQEKIPEELALRLPAPSYILQTSANSQQWGYILKTPETNPVLVDNLLSGLVSHGLVPDAKDPGMKGVTRYVRLPDGYNNKATKGEFKCHLVKWSPFTRTTIEALAAPFNIDLTVSKSSFEANRKDCDDHPILEVFERVDRLKEGGYDVRCPWVEEHTNQADNGAMVFFNTDGSIGFKCHHSHGHGTGDLLNWLRENHHEQYDRYRFQVFTEAFEKSEKAPVQKEKETPSLAEQLLEKISLMLSDSSLVDNDEWMITMIKAIYEAPKLKQTSLMNAFRGNIDHSKPGYSKKEVDEYLKALKEEAFGKREGQEFDYDNYVYVMRTNEYFNLSNSECIPANNLEKIFGAIDEEIPINMRRKCLTAYDMYFYPGRDLVFEYDGSRYINNWRPPHQPVATGDVNPWLDHIDRIGFTEAERDHLLDWMAFTVQHQDKKINHAVILGGSQGQGKDFILHPLKLALGKYVKEVNAESIVSGYDDHMIDTKLIYINDIDTLSSRIKIASEIDNKLKPLCAAPPHVLHVNPKGKGRVEIQNVFNVIASTNSRLPFYVPDSTRRLWGKWIEWSAVGDMERINIIQQAWEWMNDGNNSDKCINYLYGRDVGSFNYSGPAPYSSMVEDMLEFSDSRRGKFHELAINKVGCFARDLIELEEVHTTIDFLVKSGKLAAGEIPLKKQSLNKALSETFRRLTRANKDGYTIFAVREPEKYSKMSTEEIVAEYKANRIDNDAVVMAFGDKK